MHGRIPSIHAKVCPCPQWCQRPSCVESRSMPVREHYPDTSVSLDRCSLSVSISIFHMLVPVRYPFDKPWHERRRMHHFWHVQSYSLPGYSGTLIGRGTEVLQIGYIKYWMQDTSMMLPSPLLARAPMHACEYLPTPGPTMQPNPPKNHRPLLQRQGGKTKCRNS
jgi:hypothetical protein